MRVTDNPIAYEAIQYTGSNEAEISMYAPIMVKYIGGARHNYAYISDRTVDPGDWVVIDQRGIVEVYTEDEFRNKFYALD